MLSNMLCAVLLLSVMSSRCWAQDPGDMAQSSVDLREMETTERPATAEDLAPTRLQDGVLVLGGEELRTTRAYWTILVTLQAPSYPSGLAPIITSLRNTQKRLRFYAPVQLGWSARLLRMREVLSTDYVPPQLQTGLPQMTRQKRALVGGIGQAMGWLFGTATQEEVDRYAAATRQLQQKVGNMIHITKGLLTVVDQSRTFIRKDHLEIVDLTRHQKLIGQYVNAISGKLAGWEKRLHAIEARLEMNRAIEDAERIYEIYRQQVLEYHEQRTSLERGMLSEHILEPELLQQIVEHTAKAGHPSVSSLSWLYRFSAVEPVVLVGPTLMYRLALPVLTDHSYLRFMVYTLPSPIPHSGMSVHINLAPSYL